MSDLTVVLPPGLQYVLVAWFVSRRIGHHVVISLLAPDFDQPKNQLKYLRLGFGINTLSLLMSRQVGFKTITEYCEQIRVSSLLSIKSSWALQLRVPRDISVQSPHNN